MPCRGCGGGGSRGVGGHTHNVLRSRYSRNEARAPAFAPPPVIVQPQRRSMFRDAAAIAGGVTVGQTMGNIVSGGLSRLFGGGHQREVAQILPRDYQVGSEPTGPCAYEINQFLQCATGHTSLEECEAYGQALRECKRHYRIP